MSAPQHLAVDTNVLINLADGEETVVDCLATCSARLNVEAVVVVPTVLHELAFIAESSDRSAAGSAARALRSLIKPWGFSPMNCIPVGHGIVAETARKILADGLLPEEERNDAFVLAEAGLVGASILLTADHPPSRSTARTAEAPPGPLRHQHPADRVALADREWFPSLMLMLMP